MNFLVAVGLFSTCLTLVTAQTNYKLPKNWNVCKRSDPSLNTCLKNSITLVIKDLKNGNQNFQVPPLDPVKLNQLILKQGTSTAVGITLNFKNLLVHGLSKAIIDKVSADYKNHIIKLNVHVTEPVRMEGDYTSKGRILLIPINGAGKSSLIFDNFKANIVLHNRLVTKGGKQFIECYKADIDIDTTRLHLNFKRTVNVNEGLGQNLNTFLNENWREIYRDLKPTISREVGLIFKDYTNLVFGKVPYDVIAPA